MSNAVTATKWVTSPEIALSLAKVEAEDVRAITASRLSIWLASAPSPRNHVASTAGRVSGPIFDY
jgi:hypothetical protein